MMDELIKDKSLCANCVVDNSRFLKQRFYNKKVVEIILIKKFSCTSHYKTC